MKGFGLFGMPLGMTGMMGPKNMAKTGLFGAPLAYTSQPKEEKPYLKTTAGKLGALGDIFLRASGNRGNPHHELMMQQQILQQRDRAAQQRAEQQRQATNQEWYNREEYKRANPMPVNNDTVADYQFIMDKLGAEAGEQFLRNKADPPQYRQGPDGRFYRIETAPTRPVGKLTPIGGGAPSGTGMFP